MSRVVCRCHIYCHAPVDCLSFNTDCAGCLDNAGCVFAEFGQSVVGCRFKNVQGTDGGGLQISYLSTSTSCPCASFTTCDKCKLVPTCAWAAPAQGMANQVCR